MMTPDKETVLNPLTKRVLSRWVEGGEIAMRSLSNGTIRSLVRLEQFRILSQRIWKVRLPCVVRPDWSAKSLKGFCEGILDRDCLFHEWRHSLLYDNHAQLRVRVAVASSLFLFRKVIPQELPASDVKKMIKKYVKKMTSPQSPPPADFLSFVREKVKSLFKSGWDEGWARSCANFTLPTSSCLESKRSNGGVRGLDRQSLRAEFMSFVEGKNPVRLSRETKPMVIWTGGKWRLVTKFAAERAYLSPVHQVIYNHLSRKKWLLRGEATPDRFDDFTRSDGEVFVSGDYESATDNLNIYVTLAIIDSLCETSTYVPTTVWDAAKAALVNVFPNGKSQSRGQLMGSLLSFPLLCITNFLAFKWAVPRKVPLKINGDDIVFRATSQEAEKWFKTVEMSGLKVSKGKTLVSRNVFSLNSTFFLPKTDKVDLCPTVRSTCLFGPAEDATAISGRLKSVFGGRGLGRDLTHGFALREMGRQVWSSQRSVRRGLGATVSWRALNAAGLKAREVFYNQVPKEPSLPLKMKVWSQNAIPDNYERVPRSTVHPCDDPDFYREMIECCWTRDPIVREKEKVCSYWRYVREGTFRYVPQFPWRIAKMAGFSYREYLEFCNRRLNTLEKTKETVWVKVPPGALASPLDLAEPDGVESAQ